jgi:hypothetical protein
MVHSEEVSMRTMVLLMGILALALGACSDKRSSSTVPPLPDKTLLPGKWKNNMQNHFLTGCEFDEDGGVKVMFWGMKGAVLARYTWSSERTVDMEYSKEADVQQAYEAAAKAYRNDINDRIKQKKLDRRAGPTLLGRVANKLPEKETFSVGIADPKFLVLSRRGGAPLTLQFEKED